jgi:hypothetical protein
MITMDTTQLVNRCQEGDSLAIEALVRTYKPQVYRLGAFSPPLRAKVLKGDKETGPQSSELFFPSEGCWEITGKVGNAELTFVMRVVNTQ